MRINGRLWIGFLMLGIAVAGTVGAVDAPIGVVMGKRLAVVTAGPVLKHRTGVYTAKLTLVNKTKTPLFGPFSIVLTGASRPGVNFSQPDGDSTQGPYVLVHPPEERLNARKKLSKIVLSFSNSSGKRFKPRFRVFGLLAPNHAPVANAGSDQSVNLGQSVHLDGSASADADGQALSGLWTLLERPAGSQASLANAQGLSTDFIPDLPGTYLAQLVVNDRITNSLPASVAITVIDAGHSGPVPSGSVLSGAFLVDAPVLTEPPLAAPDNRLIPAPALAALPLLNEVRYQAGPNQPVFVELKGTTPAAIAAGLVLRNSQGQTFSVPNNINPKDQNGIITIYFDGQNQVIGDYAHAGPANFLGGTTGTLSLEDATGTVLDSVQWGVGNPNAVAHHSTGFLYAVDNVTLSRQPWSVVATASSDWYVSWPQEATPGGPNRYSGMDSLFPGDNEVVQAADATLSWSSVQGALDFTVQVATDVDFLNVVLEQTVTDAPVTLSLDPGGYYWRVQVRYGAGQYSDWSQIRRLILLGIDPVGSASIGAATNVGAGNSGATASTFAAASAAIKTAQILVGVPLYSQHKDSSMLVLESDQRTGTAHAWNAPHPGLDIKDPADKMNCAVASISMIHGFFALASSDKPKLTQDRINLEIYTKTKDPLVTRFPGPEFDTGFGEGLNSDETTYGLNYALGSNPTPHALWVLHPEDESPLVDKNIPSTALREDFWKDLQSSVEKGAPVLMMVANNSFAQDPHAMVAVGWGVDTRGVRWVYVNDPWMVNESKKKPRLIWLGSYPLLNYWTIPKIGTLASEEVDFSQPPKKGGANPDTDQDNVSDYEEVHRFKTDPHKADTDADCIPDFEEIEGSVFNWKHGWGTKWGPIMRSTPTKPIRPLSDGANRDGKAPEKDGVSPDRDGGGLPDTLEDFNLNGKYDKNLGETDPDDPADDLTHMTGFRHDRRDQPNLPGNLPSLFVQDSYVTYDLHAAGDGTFKGTADITTNQSHTITDPSSGCKTVTTMDQVKFTSPVTGRFQCQNLRIEDKLGFLFPNWHGRLVDTCTGDAQDVTEPQFRDGGSHLFNGLGVVEHNSTHIIYREKGAPQTFENGWFTRDSEATLVK